MPKQKITKDMVINAAFELARSDGMEQLIVKNIAERLGCSVQPIYSYCSNMNSLRMEVMEQAGRFVQEYLAKHTDPHNLFQSTGHAFVRLAREEPNIFKLFILRPRDNISSLEELYESETDENTSRSIAAALGISLPRAKALHLNMLIYTVGIGTIFSVASPGISPDEILTMQERAYQAFLRDALAGADTTADADMRTADDMAAAGMAAADAGTRTASGAAEAQQPRVAPESAPQGKE